MKTVLFVVLTLLAFGLVTGITQSVLTASGLTHAAWSLLALALGLVVGRVVWASRNRFGKAKEDAEA